MRVEVLFPKINLSPFLQEMRDNPVVISTIYFVHICNTIYIVSDSRSLPVVCS